MVAKENQNGSLKTRHAFWIACVLFAACGGPESPTMDFLDPQPLGVENAKSFNRQYRGRYIDPEDGSSLVIDDNRMVVTLPGITLKFSRYDIDSSFTGDRNDNRQIEAAFKGDGIAVDKIDGDTICVTIIRKDTIFSLSASGLLRHHRGSYFLSTTHNQVDWQVRRLDLKRGKLSISTITPSDSLFAVLPVQEKSIVKDDSGVVVAYKIRPSKKELKKLVKTHTFKEVHIWIKEK